MSTAVGVPQVSRASRWWSSWWVALRLNRREIRRQRLRTAFVALTVALPVLILLLLVGTDLNGSLRGERAVSADLGEALAQVEPRSEMVLDQTGAGEVYSSHEAELYPGQPQPGIWTPALLQRALGGRVHQAANVSVAVVNDGRWLGRNVLEADVSAPPYRGMAVVRSGRLPARAGEIVVNPATHRLLHDAPVSLRLNGVSHPVTVVGEVALNQELIAFPGTLGVPSARTVSQDTRLLVARSTPFSADEQKRLGRYGLSIDTRQELAARQGSTSDWNDAILLGPLLLLFFEIALLTAPAFTMGALRSRRALAQVALNGADRRQVNWVVMGQAVILGWIPATLAAVVAVPAAWVISQWKFSRDTGWTAGHDVPWSALGAVLGCALLASLAGAMWPARGMGRRDVVQLLSHRPPPDRPRRSVPPLALGAAAMFLVVQILAVSAAAFEPDGRKEGHLGLLAAAASVGLVISTMFLIPSLLAALTRRTSSGPLALRLAGRDALRQRSRSVSAISAVLGASAVLSLSAALLGPPNNNWDQEGFPVPAGWTEVGGPVTEDPLARKMFHKALGGSVPLVQTFGPAFKGVETQIVDVVEPNCGADLTRGDGATRCALGGGEPVAVARADLPRLPLTPKERSVLAAGGVVNARAATVSATTASLAWRRVTPDGEPVLDRIRRLPAVPLAPENRLGPSPLIAKESLTALGVPVSRSSVWLPVTLADKAKERLHQVFPDDAVSVAERHRRESQIQPIRWFVAAALVLAVFASVSATVLAQTEQRPHLRIMQALGASDRMARSIAAAQAGLICLIGSVIGVLAGLPLGLAYASTNPTYVQPDFPMPEPPDAWERLWINVQHVPWLWLIGFIMMTTAVAASLGWVLARPPRRLVVRRG